MHWFCEACIGGYKISHIPLSKQASIPYKLANIPIINLIIDLLIDIPESNDNIEHSIPGSNIDSILYPWK